MHLTASEALDRLEALYESALAALRTAISDYISDGKLPDVGARAKGLFAYHFYEGAISEHLQIGIRAIDLLRAEGDKLHSRKLRTFNEPPFR